MTSRDLSRCSVAWSLTTIFRLWFRIGLLVQKFRDQELCIRNSHRIWSVLPNQVGWPRELENQRGGQRPLDRNTSEWGGACRLKTTESQYWWRVYTIEEGKLISLQGFVMLCFFINCPSRPCCIWCRIPDAMPYGWGLGLDKLEFYHQFCHICLSEFLRTLVFSWKLLSISSEEKVQLVFVSIDTAIKD